MQRRKFHRLKLELDFIYLFPMNWTLVHKIDENSPLYNKNIDQLINQNTEILVMVRGFDDTYGQFIFKNHSYHIDSLIEKATFIPMYETVDDKTILFINKLNDHKKL
jgi:inward rectifier potassium channel